MNIYGDVVDGRIDQALEKGFLDLHSAQTARKQHAGKV